MRQLTVRQKQIIDATLDIIATIGIQNLTIRKLAEKVGVTEGAIYRHDPSKDEILVSIAEYFESESTGILPQIVESKGDTIQKIKTFFLGRCRAGDFEFGLLEEGEKLWNSIELLITTS